MVRDAHQLGEVGAAQAGDQDDDSDESDDDSDSIDTDADSNRINKRTAAAAKRGLAKPAGDALKEKFSGEMGASTLGKGGINQKSSKQYTKYEKIFLRKYNDNTKKINKYIRYIYCIYLAAILR